jgi:hypothetical protein
VTDHADTTDLDSALAEFYRGPLEEFVGRRDGLAKDLRAEGRRDEAQGVKGLRKPARTAWALNAAVNDDPEAVERCAAAVANALEAQSEGGDLRSAYDELRAAVRNLAAAAARASQAAGHALDQADLVPAASAVIGDASAFEDLRAGRLVSIPAAGGLDRLTGMSPPAAPTATAKTAPKRKRSAARTKAPADEAAQAATQAHERLRGAEAAAKSAHERSQAAVRALRKAESNAEAADEQLRQAQENAQAMRAELDQAYQEAEAAKEQERAGHEADSRPAGNWNGSTTTRDHKLT